MLGLCALPRRQQEHRVRDLHAKARELTDHLPGGSHKPYCFLCMRSLFRTLLQSSKCQLEMILCYFPAPSVVKSMARAIGVLGSQGPKSLELWESGAITARKPYL